MVRVHTALRASAAHDASSCHPLSDSHTPEAASHRSSIGRAEDSVSSRLQVQLLPVAV